MPFSQASSWLMVIGEGKSLKLSVQALHSGREGKDGSAKKAFRHIFIHFVELEEANFAEEAQLDSNVLSLFGTDRVLSFPSVHATSKQLLCLRRVDGNEFHSPFCCIMLARSNPGNFSHGYPLASGYRHHLLLPRGEGTSSVDSEAEKESAFRPFIGEA
jgi:hypothetical protein